MIKLGAPASNTHPPRPSTRDSTTHRARFPAHGLRSALVFSLVVRARRCFWFMHGSTMRCFCRNVQQTIAGCGARAYMRQCGCVAASRMLQNARACTCACTENKPYWVGVACTKHNRSHQALQRLTKFRCQVHNRTQACALLMRNNNIATRLCTQARVMRPTGMP